MNCAFRKDNRLPHGRGSVWLLRLRLRFDALMNRDRKGVGFKIGLNARASGRQNIPRYDPRISGRPLLRPDRALRRAAVARRELPCCGRKPSRHRLLNVCGCSLSTLAPSHGY
jgi:hypothetical protein